GRAADAGAGRVAQRVGRRGGARLWRPAISYPKGLTTLHNRAYFAPTDKAGVEVESRLQKSLALPGEVSAPQAFQSPLGLGKDVCGYFHFPRTAAPSGKVSV